MIATSHRRRDAIREKNLDECRSKAIAMMELPLGQQAVEGGYYSEMFRWLYYELAGGGIPAGVPARRLEERNGRSSGSLGSGAG